MYEIIIIMNNRYKEISVWKCVIYCPSINLKNINKKNIASKIWHFIIFLYFFLNFARQTIKIHVRKGIDLSRLCRSIIQTAFFSLSLVLLFMSMHFAEFFFTYFIVNMILYIFGTKDTFQYLINKKRDTRKSLHI